jgi:hypothetical protein
MPVSRIADPFVTFVAFVPFCGMTEWFDGGLTGHLHSSKWLKKSQSDGIMIVNPTDLRGNRAAARQHGGDPSRKWPTAGTTREFKSGVSGLRGVSRKKKVRRVLLAVGMEGVAR